MNIVHKNIIANYIGKLWGFISVYLFIPLYIKILGIEAYAVISFYTVLLAIMFIADTGLSATFSRETARTNDKVYLNNLLFTIERLYLIICTSVALIVIVCSPLIATYWLQSETIPTNKLAHYIALMGISIALQLFTTLYNGGLMGMQKQILANSIQICYSLIRSGFVIIPLLFCPNLYIYFIWQIGINLITLLFTRRSVWKFIKTNITPVFSLPLLKNIWKFALGMMAMALISSLNTQMDKILTSNLLSLVDFGHYSLASTIAQVPCIITLPIAIAILPQLTRLSEEKKEQELRNIYHKYSYIISTLAVVSTLVLFFYSKDYVFLWTRDKVITENIYQVVRILLVGSMFLTFQYMPYHLSIANGHNLTNVKLGISSLLLIIPSLVFLIPRLGLIGAGIPWAIVNFMAFLILGYLLTKRFLHKQFKSWIINDITLPTISAVIVGTSIYLASLYLPKGYYIILYSAVIGVFTIAFNLLIFQKKYPEINILKSLNFIKNKKT